MDDTFGKKWCVGQGKVHRVTANHSLSSTASHGTSSIPVSWFLVLGCNVQAQTSRWTVIPRFIVPVVQNLENKRWKGDQESMNSQSSSFHLLKLSAILFLTLFSKPCKDEIVKQQPVKEEIILKVTKKCGSRGSSRKLSLWNCILPGHYTNCKNIYWKSVL